MAALAMPRESAVRYCGGLFAKAQGCMPRSPGADRVAILNGQLQAYGLVDKPTVHL